MAGPFARILAQIIIAGAGVASRAFMQAYQQAVHNAKSGKKATQAASAAMRKGQMSKSEALDILNLDAAKRMPSLKEINERYDKYFNANDPNKGGSFYLQSKIYRAKETLERIEREEEEAASGERKNSSSN